MLCRVLRHPSGKIWAVGKEDGFWWRLYGPDRRDADGYWVFRHVRRADNILDRVDADMAIQRKVTEGFVEAFAGEPFEYGYEVVARNGGGIHVAPLRRARTVASIQDASVVGVNLEAIVDLGFVPVPF